MIELGFNVVRKKKGTYVDSHECEDIVDYSKKILRRMVSLGLLNENCAPSEEAKKLFQVTLAVPLPKLPRRQSSSFMTSQHFNPTKTNPLFGQKKVQQ